MNSFSRVGRLTGWLRTTQLDIHDYQRILSGALLLLALNILGERAAYLALLRQALGALYVLFVPGYCLSAALFPHAASLGRAERLGISLGLSIVVVPLLALALDRGRFGFGPWPVLIAEYGLILGASIIGIIRRAQLPPAGATAPNPSLRRRWRRQTWSDRSAYALSGAALMLSVGSIFWIARTPTPRESLTEFYALGARGMAEDYPRSLTLGQPLDLLVGVANSERTARTYRIEVWALNNLDLSQRAIVTTTKNFSLRPGQRLEQTLSWTMPWAGQEQPVDLVLFVEGDASVYRRLRLWVNVTPPRAGVLP